MTVCFPPFVTPAKAGAICARHFRCRKGVVTPRKRGATCARRLRCRKGVVTPAQAGGRYAASCLGSRFRGNDEEGAGMTGCSNLERSNLEPRTLGPRTLGRSDARALGPRTSDLGRSNLGLSDARTPGRPDAINSATGSKPLQVRSTIAGTRRRAAPARPISARPKSASVEGSGTACCFSSP